MNSHLPPGCASDDPVRTIRSTLNQLSALDPNQADLINALAFVLMRVADVDQSITPQERAEMEEILIEHGRLTAAQAVVVVEIAKHRARLSDCGRSYGESRWLRSEFDRDRLRRVLACLCSVASADGDTSPSESGEIHQIALELGFSADDIEA